LLVIGLNFGAVPGAFAMIFKGALGIDSAASGISIGLILIAMKKGVARGIFSNEAGQGSAPIAHAAARNNDPVNQGIIAMLGTVIDTMIVCTITALVILTSGVMEPQCFVSSLNLATFATETLPAGCDTSAPLTISAFEATLTGVGKHIVAIGLTVFAFTTILGWSYYGERCASYLFTERIIPFYRLLWVGVVFFSAAAISLQSKLLKVTGQSVGVSGEGKLLVDGQEMLNYGKPIEEIFIENGKSEALDPSMIFTINDGQVFLENTPVEVTGPVGNVVNMFWLMADTLTGLMAAPNLIALVLLSPIVFKMSKEYFDREKTASDGLIDQDDIK